MEDNLTQISQQNTEDIKQHTSNHVSQVQEVLSKEIKELEGKLRKKKGSYFK